MQAIILAAGMGKRLGELTHNNTKCMVEVNGKTLIDRMLHQIEKFSFSKVIIVVGYEGEKLIKYINTFDLNIPVTFITNPIYDQTNNIYSLYLAKDYLCEEDTVLFESDLIFEDSLIEALLFDPRPTLALVDKYQTWMDGSCVKLNSDDSIACFISNKEFDYNDVNHYYKTVNIYKFSKEFSKSRYVPFLDAYQKALGKNEYYEQVLKVISILEDSGIKAKRLNGEKWYEIDDIQDLNIAESIFASDEQKSGLLSKRYGGYWRYSQLKDFCYLVNPFYPPQKMIHEIKNSFEVLLTQYPSGMEVNSLLAARNFSVHQENIVVGNGAAELIKAFMENINGKIGIVRPTFEEYGNRYDKEKLEVFWPQSDDFRYTVNELIDYFDGKDIKAFILINPDNPSGNYINKNGILKLINWTKKKNIVFLVDESFVDFSDELESSIISQAILDEYKHLFVMKSISKSYGVPGLRLGVLASGNIDLISELKKNVSIWNINSFAEFYLQIADKYKNDYKKAMEKFRVERKRYVEELAQIPGLRVFPSQANFVMAEIINGMSSDELNTRLIANHDILIKSLSGKISKDSRQFVRLAVKTKEENDDLILSIKKEFELFKENI